MGTSHPGEILFNVMDRNAGAQRFGSRDWISNTAQRNDGSSLQAGRIVGLSRETVPQRAYQTRRDDPCMSRSQALAVLNADDGIGLSRKLRQAAHKMVVLEIAPPEHRMFARGIDLVIQARDVGVVR